MRENVDDVSGYLRDPHTLWPFGGHPGAGRAGPGVATRRTRNSHPQCVFTNAYVAFYLKKRDGQFMVMVKQINPQKPGSLPSFFRRPRASAKSDSSSSPSSSMGVWQGVAMDSLDLYPGLPCHTLQRNAEGPSLKRPYSHFRGDPPAGWAPCGHLLPFWTPHAVRLCLQPQHRL
jgi:hypothetical protein